MRVDLPELGRLKAERAALPPPDHDVLRRLAGLHRLALLDSCGAGRFTVLAASPLARLTWRPGHGEVALPGGARAREDDFRTLLREALATTATGATAPLPFGPGWIGTFGYGLRVAFEAVPERHADRSGLPDVDLSYYPAVAVYDREQAAWWLLRREGAPDSLRNLRACIVGSAAAPSYRVQGPAKACITRDAYRAAVQRAVEYIHAGDVFQVNYAHEYRAGVTGAPFGLYLALRRSNPAPYAAYLDLGDDSAVLSTSPELFLSVRGRAVSTRPIKGTRPRGVDDARDAERIAELRASEKDAAELAMIVDLMRNDLGRVARPGSVIVTEAARIESYASVHHRVAEVRAELEAGRDRTDLLAATFPGGSITGAPKVRAMEIIDELETGRRGPYTGCIGILADDGSMDLNIAIRTVVVRRGEVSVHVGGGIVADSSPDDEYMETLAKGKAILEALD